MIGQTIGVYKILEKRGEGGMGIFYKAHDEVLDEIVGLKTLHRDLVADPNFQQDLQGEAKLQARLREHPGIVRLNHYLIHEGQHFLVMEFVDGQTIGEKIADWGPYSFNDAAIICIKVLDALGYAHSEGVVHRDIKPSNIMVTDDGQVKVTDFGIAKHLDSGQKTRTTQIKGSLFYMAPEQIQHGEIDGRTDLYALGVTLYEMVTGTVPFTAESEFSIMKKHIEEKPPSPSSFNAELKKVEEELILHALEKNKEDRFQTTEEFAGALRDVVSVSDTATGITPLQKDTVKIDSGTTSGKKHRPAKKAKPQKDGEQSSSRKWLKILAYGLVAVLGFVAIDQLANFGLLEKIIGSDPPTIDTPPEIKTTVYPPQWDYVDNQTVEIDDTLKFSISATHQDDSILRLELLGNPPPTAEFIDYRDNTGLFEMSPGPDDIGEYRVHFVASSGNLSDTMFVDIIVRPRAVSPSDPALTVDVEPFNERAAVTGVWVDGRRQGAAVPFEIRGLRNGKRWVKIQTSAGYYTNTVNWAGDALDISFFVSTATDRVTISAELSDGSDWANIYIDDQEVGQFTPFQVDGVLLGSHKIEVRREGFRLIGGARIVDVQAGGETKVNFRLEMQ